MDCSSRRCFLQSSLGLAGLGLLTGCGLLPTVAKQPVKVPRVGVMTSASAGDPTIDAFLQGLGELGYADGRNLALEWRYTESNADRLPPFAAELVQLNVDVIVANGPGVLAARAATTTIPIVAASFSDLVGSGLAASLAHPGGNVTGLTTLAPQLAGKRLQLLNEMIPTARKIAGLWNTRDPAMQAEFGTTLVAAQALGLQFQSLPIGGIEELENAFALAGQSGTEALAVISDIDFRRNRSQIVELCAKSRLPAITNDSDFPRVGGLAAYGVSFADLWRRSATYVDKILKGTKPADLPVEQPTKFDLVINLKTAQALGLTIPQSVLQQATEVIQ